MIENRSTVYKSSYQTFYGKFLVLSILGQLCTKMNEDHLFAQDEIQYCNICLLVLLRIFDRIIQKLYEKLTKMLGVYIALYKKKQTYTRLYTGMWTIDISTMLEIKKRSKSTQSKTSSEQFSTQTQINDILLLQLDIFYSHPNPSCQCLQLRNLEFLIWDSSFVSGAPVCSLYRIHLVNSGISLGLKQVLLINLTVLLIILKLDR